jgi:TM2 domain-containing membrane protein YozV
VQDKPKQKIGKIRNKDWSLKNQTENQNKHLSKHMFKLKRTAQAFFACTLWQIAKRGFVVLGHRTSHAFAQRSWPPAWLLRFLCSFSLRCSLRRMSIRLSSLLGKKLHMTSKYGTQVVLFLLLLPLFFLTRGGTGVPHAYAATSDNLNFQARLETAAGAIAPDGDYNIQFKLYDALSGGTLLWTETYYDSNGGTAGNDNRVRVANGYVTVNLGSQTAFPGTMPWDQQLYLTMNVGGTTQTATPTWDGEMSPRLKLTAVPYAFNAKTASQIVSSSGANLATLSIAAPTSGNQTFTIQDQGAAGSYNILTETQINTGYIQNQFGAAQATSNFWLSGTGRADTAFQAPLFDSGTAAALGIGTTNATSISIGKSTITTTVQGPFVANGSQFTNNGSTLLTGSTLSDFAVSGAIGTAAATVDTYTTFVIPQTTAGRTLSLPTPTTGTAGRLAYVLNTGSTPFTMHSVSIQAGKAQTYIYDGSAWTATNIDGAGNGVTFIGTIDSQTKSADGAVISGNGIYLQTADGTNPGLVSTGIQTFAGNKTFSGTVTATAGGSIYGGTINLNANSNFDTNINTGTSTGAVAIGNSAAGNISVQSGGTISVLGTTSINTTGTATTTIGSATAGAVSITSNAASNFTTNTGALTLTSAAAATWGTNAGLLTLQGAGGATVTSSAGTTSSNTTISTGNASAGASGNIVIDTGTATTTAGTVSIGTTNASGVTIGRAATTTTIQGNTAVTLSGTTGTTVVCQNGSGYLSSCDATYLTPTATNFIQNNPASQQTSSSFNIAAGAGVVAAKVQGAAGQDIMDLYTSAGGSPAVSVDVNGGVTITGTSTSQFVVKNASASLLTADTTNSLVAVGSTLAGACNGSGLGKFCVGQQQSSGGTNASNIFNIQGTSNNLTANGQKITVYDTGTGTGNTTQALVIDNTSTTNTNTTVNGILVKSNNTNSGNLINLQGGSSGGKTVFSVTNAGLVGIGTPYNGGNGSTGQMAFYYGTGGTNTGSVILQTAAQGANNYTLTIPTLTANANICTDLGNCSGVNGYIVNQNTAQQASSNFWISGTGRADTSVLTPLLDTPSGTTTLNIGTTNATAGINLNQDVTLAANKGITIPWAAGGNVDAVQIDVNGTSLFNVDTSNSRVTVGSVGGCLGAYGFGQGKLCLNGNVTGVSSYNMQNTTLIMQSSGAGAKIVGNVVNIADTLNTNANDDYGFIVDSTDRME